LIGKRREFNFVVFSFDGVAVFLVILIFHVLGGDWREEKEK
jgi:hypothetical protein